MIMFSILWKIRREITQSPNLISTRLSVAAPLYSVFPVTMDKIFVMSTPLLKHLSLFSFAYTASSSTVFLSNPSLQHTNKTVRAVIFKNFPLPLIPLQLTTVPSSLFPSIAKLLEMLSTPSLLSFFLIVAVVQLLSRVRLFATPWTAAHHDSIPIITSTDISH